MIKTAKHEFVIHQHTTFYMYTYRRATCGSDNSCNFKVVMVISIVSSYLQQHLFDMKISLLSMVTKSKALLILLWLVAYIHNGRK